MAYVSGFGMAEPELELFTGPSSPLRLASNPSTVLVLNPNELPIDAASSTLPGKLFDIWRALRVFYELRHALPRSEKTLIDYFKATDAAVRRATLVEAAGWDAGQMNAVLQALEGATPPTSLPEPPDTVPSLVRLQRAMALLKRVGATPDRVFTGRPWIMSRPTRSSRPSRRATSERAGSRSPAALTIRCARSSGTR